MAEETPLERFRRQVLPGRTVKDVTDVIERTCKSMKPGQMVHSETFTLMEAVSAIELGDPKVDIGVIPEARDTGLPTDLFKAGRAPLELDLDSLLSLLDGMLARELSWYRGNFLAETLYTCIYLHDMDRLGSNSILKAFCELTRLTCLKVLSLVHRAGVSEEEDFCIAYNGLPLHADSGGSDNPQTWLNFASVVIEKLLKVAASTTGTISLNSEDFPIGGKLSKQDIEKIAARIELRSSYLNIINFLEDDRETNSKKLEKYIRQAQSSLDIIAESFHESSENECGWFVKYLNKACMPAIPPRTIDKVSGSEVIQYFKDFLEHAIVVSMTTKCKNILTLQRHLEDFSDRNPQTIIRSLQSLICSKLNLKGVVSSSFGLTVKYLESEPELACCLDKCATIAEAYTNAACHNKCQQHRKFKKLLRELNDSMEQLKVLQMPLQTLSQTDNRSEGGDTHIGRSELAILIIISWLCAFSHSIALKQMLVGFDLELYEKTDFLMIYWYCERLLTDYIAAVQEWNSQLVRMNEMTKKGKGRKQRKDQKQSIVLLNEDQVMGRIFVLESMRLAFNGTVRMLAALKKYGSIECADLSINRYAQRFRHFQSLAIPEPLGYGAYDFATKTGELTASQLCESAKLSFANSLRLVSHLKATLPLEATENKKVTNTLQRVCTTNSIAMKCCSASTDLVCDFEFDNRIIVLKLRSF